MFGGNNETHSFPLQLKMATRGTLIKGLKVASVYSAGLFAGGVVFMRAVDTPTRFSMAKELPDGHKAAMRHFRFMHNHVEKMQVRMRYINLCILFLMRSSDLLDPPPPQMQINVNIISTTM